MKPETIIMSSSDDSLRLTNHRVVHEAGDSYSSIPLHHVAACSFTIKSYPLVAVLGWLLTLLGGLAIGTGNAEQQASMGALGAGIVLLVAWWMLRRGMLEVQSSSGHKISVETKRLSYQEVKQFAEAVAAELMKRT